MNSLRPAFVLVLLLSSCSSNSSAPAMHDDDEAGDVIYVGGVTDEALDRLLDITPKQDPRQAVIVESPDLGTPLPKDSAATFKFHLASEEAMLAPKLRVGPAPNPHSRWERAFHELVQFVSPERIAHAHGAPYNGIAYYLVFSDADSTPILKVFAPDTSMAGKPPETSFTPEDADWKTLVQAPQPLTLKITSAYFEENDVPADGGPFVGGSFPFTIE